MPTYLLDMVIDEAQLTNCMDRMKGVVWLMIRADGDSQTICTSHETAEPLIKFNQRVRMSLTLPTLEGQYLKVSLFSNDETGKSMVLAASQVRLNMIPHGSPKKFVFPLIVIGSTTDEAAIVKMTANICQSIFDSNSRFTYTSVPPPLPPKTIFGRHNLQSSYTGNVSADYFSHDGH